MTQDEIIEMAREAGLEVDGVYFSDTMYRAVLVCFANLVATKEKEACAKLVDARLERWVKNIGKDKMYKWMRGLPEVIRARGDQA